MKHGFTMHDGYLTIPAFEKTRLVAHGFTMKHEGEIPGIELSTVVSAKQVHGREIYLARRGDTGIAGEYDGIITNVPGLAISTYHADCTPIFLLDTKTRSIGVVHAGWRGTALGTLGAALDAMTARFSSEPCDILAAIGPTICRDCYECGEEVLSAMREGHGARVEKFFTGRNVDLVGINADILLRRGVAEENITICGECTNCKSDIYWSHRATHGVRGRMRAIMKLL